MFRKTVLLFFIVALITSSIVTHASAQDFKPRIAFIMFVPQNVEATPLIDTIPTLMTMAVIRTGHFEILEKKKIEKAVELEGFKLSGIALREIATLGNKLGFDFGVIGDVRKERGMIVTNVRVLDIRNNTTCYEDTITATEGGLNDKIHDAATLLVEKTLACYKSADKPPEPPVNVRVTAGAKKIRISWGNSDPKNVAGFKVFRAGDEGGPYTLLNIVSETTFVDENLPLNETVYYKVKAVNKGSLESDFSNAVRGRVVTGPPPPILLLTEPDVKSAHLKWRSRPGTDVAHFRLYRKEINEKEFKEVMTFPAGNLEYQDRGLKDDATYHYALSAIDQSGAESDMSSVLDVKTLRVPEGLRAEIGKIMKINLSWEMHPSQVIEGYNLYRATERAGDYRLINKIRNRSMNNYLDTERMGDATTYWYRVSALNRDGVETDKSQEVSGTTRGKPPVPEGLTAKNSEPRRVSLRWVPIKSPEDEIKGYFILRSMNERGQYLSIADISGANVDNYIDKDPPLKDNTTYYYAIASYNSAGIQSTLSVPVSSTTKEIPHIPKGLKATNGEVKQVTLSWEPNAEKDIREYILFRSVTGEREFSRIAYVKGRTLYVDSGLRDGVQYSYTIRAADEDNLISEQAPVATGVTKPLPKKPSGLKVSEQNGKRLLQWDPNPENDVKQYNVYRKGFLGVSQKITTVQGNSWIVDESEGKKRHELFVTAVNDPGLESEGSDIIVIEK